MLKSGSFCKRGIRYATHNMCSSDPYPSLSVSRSLTCSQSTRQATIIMMTPGGTTVDKNNYGPTSKSLLTGHWQAHTHTFHIFAQVPCTRQAASQRGTSSKCCATSKQTLLAARKMMQNRQLRRTTQRSNTTTCSAHNLSKSRASHSTPHHSDNSSAGTSSNNPLKRSVIIVVTSLSLSA